MCIKLSVELWSISIVCYAALPGGRDGLRGLSASRRAHDDQWRRNGSCDGRISQWRRGAVLALLVRTGRSVCAVQTVPRGARKPSWARARFSHTCFIFICFIIFYSLKWNFFIIKEAIQILREWRTSELSIRKYLILFSM